MVTRLRRTIAAVGCALVALVLLASPAGAVIVRDPAGHSFGIALRPGVSPTSLPGTAAAPAASHSALAVQGPPGTLSYHGGPVMHSSAPYVVYWAPHGQTIPGTTESLINRYFSDTAADSGLASNTFGVTRQYTDTTGFADYSQVFSPSAQVILDSDAYPSRDKPNCPNVATGYPTCLTDAQIQAELTHLIAAYGLPTDQTGEPPAAAPVYFVVLPTDVNACIPDSGTAYCSNNWLCAWHSWYSDPANDQNVLYAAIPTITLGAGMNPKACQYDGTAAVQEPNRTSADVALKYLNHEEIETLTDPYMNAWWENSSGNGYEAADECNEYGTGGPLQTESLNAFAPVLGGNASAGTLYDEVIDGNPYYLQSTWSNGDGTCRLRPGSGTVSARFTNTPSPVTAGTQLTFDPSSSASTNDYSSATWTFGDGATKFNDHGASMNSVTHTFAQPGTYPVTLTLVDARGNLATRQQQVTVYAGPSASFTSTTTLPYVGGATGFDASASNDPDAGVTITSYAWNFGDGLTATTTSPTTAHTYVQAGTYTVTLTVTNSVGLTSTTSNTVTIHPLPSSVFTANPTTPLANQNVSFDGSGSVEPGGSIVNYSWDFGDGSGAVSGSSATTSHTYAQAGDYNVSLTVTGSDGLTRKTTQQLIVGTPPTASFVVASPASPVQNAPVNLDASASSDADAGVSIASYSWNFGDGGTQTTASATVSHTYAGPGTYTVTLTVTNTIGLSTMQVQSITVDELPSSVFTYTPGNPPVGQTVSLDGSGSVDPDGSIVVYNWNFGDNSPVVSSSTPTTTHTYSQPGIYTVAMTVGDSDGHTRTSAQQIIVGSPPVAAVALSGPPAPVQGSPVTLDGSGSSDPDAGVTVASYNWTFGDGQSAQTTTPTTNHVYAQAGSYTATLTVTNSLGLTSPPVQVTVAIDELPSASFTHAPSNPVPGTALTFDGGGSGDPDGSIITYAWDFGDQTTAMTAAAQTTHAYSSPGTYTVTLTVTDSDGHVNRSTQQVTVYALPTAGFTSSPSTPVSGAAVSFDASSSSDPNASTITSYGWNFGDGSPPVTTSSATTAHTYSRRGSYLVSLTVTDALGLTTTASHTVTVSALPTPVFATSPSGAIDQQIVTFDGSRSSDLNGAAITTYSWDFGDGTITTGPASASTHAYTSPGAYTVKLTTTDALGLSATTSGTVVIHALPTPAFVANPGTPVDGTPVSFDATGSRDPNSAAITSFAWDFGDGKHGTGAQASHIFTAPGTYTVSLTTTDALGLTASTSRTVVVADELPSATIRASIARPVNGQTVTFDGTASKDNDGSITTYSWSFGDRSTTAWGATPTHRYSAAGTYTVTLTVTDSSHQRSNATYVLTVGQAGHITAMKAQMARSGPVLVVSVNSAGILRFGGKKVTVRHAGTVRLPVRLTHSERSALTKRGALKVHSPVTFTPHVGGASGHKLTFVFRVLRQHGTRQPAPLGIVLLLH